MPGSNVWDFGRTEPPPAEPNWAQRFMANGGLAGMLGMRSLGERMVEHQRKRAEQIAAGNSAPPRPGSEMADEAIDIAGNFDMTGRLSGKSLIKDWRWLPEKEVAAKVNVTAVPGHVADFGDFMTEMAGKAKRQEMTARDLIKAFTITRSSIQRGAMDADKLRERWPDYQGSGKVRPEGAFSDWLMTPIGKRYLDAAERGEVDLEAVSDASQKLAGFGKTNDYIDSMTTAASLPGQEGAVGEMVAQAFDKPGRGVDQWRKWAQSLRGIGPAKSGFVGSLLGRGDQPTLDARQILLQTGRTTAEAQPFLNRGSGRAANQAVDRLAARQGRMGLEMQPGQEPFRQHLTHHTLWDAYGGDKTTHADVVRAMRLAGVGGAGMLGASAASDQPLESWLGRR